MISTEPLTCSARSMRVVHFHAIVPVDQAFGLHSRLDILLKRRLWCEPLACTALGPPNRSQGDFRKRLTRWGAGPRPAAGSQPASASLRLARADLTPAPLSASANAFFNAAMVA